MTTSSLRDKPTSQLRFWSVAAFFILASHLVITLTTFRDFGMSWDHPTTHAYGQLVCKAYTSFGADLSAQTHWLHPYGGLFELVAGAVEQATGLPWPDARNLCSAFFGFVGVWAVLRLGWKVFGPPVGVAAGAALLLTPVYFGHQFINPKDLPFAALNMLAIRYVAEFALEFPNTKWSTASKLGISIGLALAVRVGGLQLYGVCLIGALGAISSLYFRTGEIPQRKDLISLLFKTVLIAILSWVLMIAFWPYAWSKPFTAPFLALKEFSKFWWDGYVFYGGQRLKASDLPDTYVLNLLVRTLPEFVLLGVTLAGVSTLRHLLSLKNPLHSPHFAPLAVMAGGVILPLGAIYILDSNLYDGLRHVLFIVPPIICIGALGLVSFFKSAQTHLGQIMAVLVAVSVVGVIADLRSLHPYQYIYFNRMFGGGIQTANRQYDLEYWGTGLREAATWVNQNYTPPAGSELIYAASAEPEQFDLFLNPKKGDVVLRRAKEGEKARLFILIRRNRQFVELGWGRILHTISRQGVPLVEIVEAP